MQLDKLIQKVRKEIKDDTEPYLNDDPDIISFLEEAAADFSKYQPRQRRGKLNLIPGVEEYPLPADYQTWISGLEGYEVVGNTLYVEGIYAPMEVSFTYWGMHAPETVPDSYVSALLDYIMFKQMDEMVQEGTEISGLKLGKGLDIKFDNFDELNKAAERRWRQYLQKVTGPVGGYT